MSIRPTDAELLDSLWDELHRGKVYECTLRDPAHHLDGVQIGDAVYIDPKPAILETVLHELLHRMKPRWREARVRKEAWNLIARMEDADKRKWWVEYRKVRKLRKPLDVDLD